MCILTEGREKSGYEEGGEAKNSLALLQLVAERYRAVITPFNSSFSVSLLS